MEVMNEQKMTEMDKSAALEAALDADLRVNRLRGVHRSLCVCTEELVDFYRKKPAGQPKTIRARDTNMAMMTKLLELVKGFPAVVPPAFKKDMEELSFSMDILHDLHTLESDLNTLKNVITSVRDYASSTGMQANNRFYAYADVMGDKDPALREIRRQLSLRYKKQAKGGAAGKGKRKPRKTAKNAPQDENTQGEG